MLMPKTLKYTKHCKLYCKCPHQYKVFVFVRITRLLPLELIPKKNFTTVSCKYYHCKMLHVSAKSLFSASASLGKMLIAYTVKEFGYFR